MIYCVEDDNGIRNMMVYTLNAAGLKAEGCEDGNALYELIGKEQPELILLDIMLPGEDGISILNKLRSSPETEDIPVIMATAKGTEYDKVIALDTGADDYLAKPFGMMEMVSRVKAVLRRAGRGKPKDEVTVGDISIDKKNYTARVKGEKLQLTLKEFELLQLFCENTERVFTREHLLSSIWGVSFAGETRTVDVHIGTLREKLGGCKDYIETVRGVGYRLTRKER